jgi:hypothetical protein
MAEIENRHDGKTQTEKFVFLNRTSSSTSNSSQNSEVFQFSKSPNPLPDNYAVEEDGHKNGNEISRPALVEKYHQRRNFDTLDSESDSGHCCSDSLDLDNSIDAEEPEFQHGGAGAGESNGQLTAAAAAAAAKLPPPHEFGGGNPFLMFLSLTLMLQHRDHVMRNRMDYNETAMYFDKMVRKHNVTRVLAHARAMYSTYSKQVADPPRPQV